MRLRFDGIFQSNFLEVKKVRFFSSWWFNHPLTKYSSKWESSPNRGEHIKYLKPPSICLNSILKIDMEISNFLGDNLDLFSRNELTEFQGVFLLQKSGEHQFRRFLYRHQSWSSFFLKAINRGMRVIFGFFLFLIDSGQIRIFHQPGKPEIRGFPPTKLPFWGKRSCEVVE